MLRYSRVPQASLRHVLRGKFAINQLRFMSEVKFRVDSTARVVTLDRPKKLNALDVEMCNAILPTLHEYSKSDVNNVVILNSSGSPRAFCSGGDVAQVAKLAKEGNFEYAKEFFTKEYSLDLTLAAMDKPVIAIMDGITMGGGVGLATHVPFRVATENTRWAMPEMDIGFFPDVGVTFSVPKITTVGGSNGQLAQYLCMTGDILNGADAYVAGVASHYVPHDQIANLQARLAELHLNLDKSEFAEHEAEMFDVVNQAIEEFNTPLPKDYKFKYSIDELNVIEQAFGIGNSLKQVFAALDEIAASQAETPAAKQFAAKTKEVLAGKSPVSLEIAKEHFQRNSSTDIQTALTQDLITAVRMSEHSDLCEFANATSHKLLEKNKTPYPWKIKDLKLSQLSTLLSQNPSKPLSLVRPANLVTFSEYPYHSKYQLPKESDVEQYITGADQQGRQTAVTKKEAVKYFQQLNPVTKNKPGVDYLVSLIIDRKCAPNQDGFLRWKSPSSKL
ncbi:3-hydroxyisobutyryl-CoA hydrolase, mitochondrial [Kluyveromyces marxianus]